MSARRGRPAAWSSRPQGLPVRARTPVTAVESGPAGFLVSTPDGTLTARTLVLASGLLNVPRQPVAGRARVAARVHQLHTADYRSAAQLPDGAVLVVGGGQSGCQIAEDLATAGRTVYLSTSRVGRIPWLYRGRESLAWLVDCGFWDQRPQDLPSPADTRLAVPLLAGGRSLDLPILAGLGVRLLGRFASADGETMAFDGLPRGVRGARRRGLGRLRRAGGPVHRGAGPSWRRTPRRSTDRRVRCRTTPPTHRRPSGGRGDHGDLEHGVHRRPVLGPSPAAGRGRPPGARRLRGSLARAVVRGVPVVDPPVLGHLPRVHPDARTVTDAVVRRARRLRRHPVDATPTLWPCASASTPKLARHRLRLLHDRPTQLSNT